MLRASCRVLQDGLQAFVGNNVQQLKRRPGGPGFTLLPFADGGGRGVQMVRKYGLAEIELDAQLLDVGGVELTHWARTQCIEPTHSYFADRSGLFKRGQVIAQ